MRSVDDAIGFLAQDPIHATTPGQLPAATVEFIEFTLFHRKINFEVLNVSNRVFYLLLNLKFQQE